MKVFCLIIFLIFPLFFAMAQPVIKTDTGAVSVRAFSPIAVENFKNDKDFQYNRYQEPPKSIWERFWDWVWFKIGQIMSTKAGRTTVYTFLIILAVAAIAFFIYKVMGMDGGKLFGRKATSPFDYNVSSDDINQISFTEAINEAVSKRNFRLAVRLLYLQSLKSLSDRELIDWKIDKTNRDYLQEVIDRSWHQMFRQLTDKFEYIWYGEANIGQDDFEKIQGQFQQFNNQLQ